MAYLFVALGGAIIGVLTVMLIALNYKTHGVIDIDHSTQQCKFRISSADLSDRKTKKAVFKINHEAIISRDEHSL